MKRKQQWRVQTRASSDDWRYATGTLDSVARARNIAETLRMQHPNWQVRIVFRVVQYDDWQVWA